ncbi:oxygen-dependent tRNA uridine(34) hydroxylase TrhO [Kocuria sp.]|uniref:oxygen-dependent tRNA uridine(34) hydroxylase TrhO n=1 Tax=Kocuria sp. TaxID=1871328 RepID=UPI0026DFE8E4|nr:rhodanese-related sulfurtransferase [Kocuria sp.]MDO5618558.1 rhodanese-related sulfurtransferase [Kocuria sp.]
MSVNRILLYYSLTPLPDPQAIALWQRALCERLGLRGRILVSPEGLNGTVGGEVNALKQYAKITRSYPGFRGMDLKWSDGSAQDFPRLSVKVRDELVAFGAPGEVQVNHDGVVGGGTHITPQELDQLAESRDDLVFFDGRNSWEARIGKFKDAVVPQVETTHDFVRELESGRYDDLKNKPVVTYCTGGIRCEFLSALMIQRGFQEVYQLDGGIVRYGEARQDSGLWEGSLAVFDARGAIDFSDQAAVIGVCDVCGAPAKTFVNCSDPTCHHRFLTCPEHHRIHDDAGLTCPAGCRPAHPEVNA